MKTLLIAAAVLAATAPAMAAPYLLDTIDGKWAIDGECGVPAKTYSASVDVRNQTITWQDGLGNIDIEHVISSRPYEFGTMTEESYHARRDNSYGTGWVYKALHSFYVMRVTKMGKTFYASRCEG